MKEDHAKADGTRVLADLNALRAMGVYKTGVHRPTFSEPHVQSLRWLLQRFPEAGLAGEIDGIGNVLGRSTKAGPKLLAGSHLESQNFAGWLDGPLGVIYALEAARVINPDPKIKGAVEVASWCDEEGHFGHFLGSRSYVGDVSEQEIDAARDRTNARPMREGLEAAGLAGRPRQNAERGRHIGYLEAHIEQGRTLEGSHLGIGVVTSIVGIWQYRITFTRRAKSRRYDTDEGSKGRGSCGCAVVCQHRRPLSSGQRTANRLDHRPHHARSRRAQHHSRPR